MKKLIENYICSGCMKGCDTECGSFKPRPYYGEGCRNHFPGTGLLGGDKIYLGLPRGMNKVGDFKSPDGESRIRIWKKGTNPDWDAFNIPVWVKQDGENLIVKTVCPRLMETYVDIIENSTKEVIKFGEESKFSMEPFDITEIEEID